MREETPYRTALDISRRSAARWSSLRVNAPGWSALPLLAISLLPAGGCAGVQSALDPAGPQSGRIAELWWFTFAICAGVYLLVMIALAVAITRRRRMPAHTGSGIVPPADDAAADADVAPPGIPPSNTPALRPDPARERRLGLAVSIAVGVTVAILLVLMVADYATGRSLSTFGAGRGARPVRIEVIGHQFWWEIHYADSIAGNRVVTANEIHIPVGRPVELSLASRDVIHSLWIPNLHGKRDLIPGRPATLTLQADRAGVFRGQCAEFCGQQHAKMALTVVAEPEGKFGDWLAHQRESAPVPEDSLLRYGQKVFLSSPCTMCHTIAGTSAGGNVGPNLTHVASRPTIGAGALANNRGNLAGWILDPQHLKPGSLMPPNILTPDDLHALLAYLESLR